MSLSWAVLPWRPNEKPTATQLKGKTLLNLVKPSIWPLKWPKETVIFRINYLPLAWKGRTYEPVETENENINFCYENEW